MTATDFLESLVARAVRLEPVGKRLRVDAPAGVLTAADRSALVELKAELLALLHAPTLVCPHCDRFLDGKRRCWPCCERICPCGRLTGSAFIELCWTCGIRYREANRNGE